jgi:hypothetical protein
LHATEVPCPVPQHELEKLPIAFLSVLGDIWKTVGIVEFDVPTAARYLFPKRLLDVLLNLLKLLPPGQLNSEP